MRIYVYDSSGSLLYSNSLDDIVDVEKFIMDKVHILLFGYSSYGRMQDFKIEVRND